MNKQIIFRGKSKCNGEWLYGDLVRNVEGTFVIVPPFEIDLHNHCERYEVDEDTIGQFTGNYDRNGKEIFDGDILCYGKNSEDTCSVEWSNKINTFCVKCAYSEILLSEFIRFMDGVEVIGNVHNNQDLIKGGKYE